MVGNVVGNVTGSLTGNVTGNVTGNLTGDVTGNLTGNVVGNVTGNLAGNASTTTKLAAPINIYGNPFDGTLELNQAVAGTYGGTGVNNGSKTITLGGNILTASNFTTAGIYSTTLTSIGETNVTLPTTGTIATLAGTETLTNKTIVSPTISSPALTGSATAITADVSSNNTLVATTAFVRSRISLDTALLIQKTAISGLIDNFRQQVSQIVEFDPGMTISERQIRLDGKLTDGDISFVFIAGEESGVYVNAEMLKIEAETLVVMEKLVKFEETYKTTMEPMITQRDNNI